MLLEFCCRTILEMLRDRKVRINEVVTYDFAIVVSLFELALVKFGIYMWKERYI